jgi:hypothetical protein
MRVPYRSRCARVGTVYEIAGPIRFCCASMCRTWGEFIGFGIRGHAATTSREVNVFTDRAQASGGTVCILTEIQHCPCCGEAVETVRVK